ncbi:hypothetical protein BGM25_26465 [Bacillus sp. FJAT-29953]|nr:hypothetical protein [Bacillus sp. FJAT-29953]
MRVLVHAVFILPIGLVTFFGLGPVLMADGSMQERLVTGVIVLVIYLILGFGYRKGIGWAERKRK